MSKSISLTLEFFFLSGFSFTDIHNSQDSREREGPSFIPPAHENSDICNFPREMTITYF